MLGRIGARIALVALAAVVVAWLALDYRADVLDSQGRAQARIAKHPAQIDQAISLFQRAARLNADPTPRLDQAKFLLSLGRNQPAVDVLNKVVQANPGNVVAWSLLASAAGTDQPLIAAKAYRQLQVLFGHPFGYDPSRGAIVAPTGVITAGQVQGAVDLSAIAGSSTKFVGWAGTLTRQRGGGLSLVPADQVLVMADGRLVYVGQTTQNRPDVARHFHAADSRVGFTFTVPTVLLEPDGHKAQVELFGTIGQVGARLPVPCGPHPQAFGCGG